MDRAKGQAGMTKIEALEFQIANLERVGQKHNELCRRMKVRLAKEQGEKKRDKNGRFCK